MPTWGWWVPRKPSPCLYPLPGAQYISFQNLEPSKIEDFWPKEVHLISGFHQRPDECLGNLVQWTRLSSPYPPFLAQQQLNRWPCHSLTHWQYFYFWHSKSDPIDLWPLRHLITVMRKHDLTNILTIFEFFLQFLTIFTLLTIFTIFDNFDNFWQFLTFLTTFDNVDNFWQFLTIFKNFWQFW